ncbi:hypothetical protein [Maricaulis maris]|uniref:Uncharacterized protein n=1 Tax=Maricaulis maris TaxID=74318 RepID=A0A495DLS5_9PROT|nr:hypothetical protein [Maricaulis maris]RKR03868.1 hypothetical protein C7435_0311 [Maricaulis maris]
MSASKKQASVTRRYFWRTFVAMIAFTAILVAIDKVLNPSLNGWDAISAWPLVALTCLPLLVYGYEVIRYVRSIDEMLARMQVRAAAIAMLAMLLFSAVFGVAEIYGIMEPLNMTMLFPLAAVVHSLAAAVQQVQVR